MARSSLNQIEKDELKIINELKINARESIDKIAHRCKFSRQKVWRIMNKLEESRKVWGYTTVTDDEKLAKGVIIDMEKGDDKDSEYENF